MCYSKYHNSNMFIASMDAEKCFDSIWHDGMFYKLYGDSCIIGIPSLTLCWNRLVIHINICFNVTRGTRQGCILSPVFFNIFICDLMNQLNYCKYVIRVGDSMYNCFAYADDISLYNNACLYSARTRQACFEGLYCIIIPTQTCSHPAHISTNSQGSIQRMLPL